MALAKALPIDANTKPVQLTPAVLALAVTVDATISASTEITLQTETSFIRFYATSQDVFLKWGTADATTTSFDEVLPAGQLCDFFVPKDITAINLIERAASAAVVVIEK